MNPWLRFYLPVSDGEFDDLIADLGRMGASCTAERPSYVRCTWRGVGFNVIHDAEGELKALITNDGGLGAHAWDQIDPIFLRMGHHTGWGPNAVGVASERVGAFFYDPDLAKFGNAFSPLVQTSSFESANLALQRPFQDRYNPRYENQPT